MSMSGADVPTRATLMEREGVAPPVLNVNRDAPAPVAETTRITKREQTLTSPAFKVIVTIHVPRQGSVVKHTEYHVYTEPSACSVVRRYSDFLWLSDCLSKAYPYCVVPALPPKQVFGRFEDKFLSQRRRGLEKFLNKLAIHPVMYDAECLVMFLKQDDKVVSCMM